MRRVASKMEARSRRFLSDAVNEVGAVLAECVVPSLPGDEGALRDVISDAVTRGEFSSLCRVVIQHARDSEDSVGEMEMTQATQATQEYVCPLPTDVAEHAAAALAESDVRQVVLAGRRGVLHAAFTIKELRELSKRAGSTLSGTGTLLSCAACRPGASLLLSRFFLLRRLSWWRR